jgi:hypothetical protein
LYFNRIGKVTNVKKTQVLDAAQIRQGDVLIVRVGDCADVAPATEPVILAHGEVTGHKHQFMAESRVSYLGREAGLKIGAPSALNHEEHSAPVVPAGIYDMPVQTEWNDDLEPRVVAD